MATYIKDLVEDNGDITRPVTEAGAVLLSGGGDLETTLASKADQTDVDGKIDVGDVQSTDIVANAVTTAKIANGAVTAAKIDDDAVTAAKVMGGETASTLAAGALVEIVGTTTGDYNFAWKFSDGRLICFQRTSFTNASTVAWGSDYRATYNPTTDFAVPFTANPALCLSFDSLNVNTNTCWPVNVGGSSTTRPQQIYLVRPSGGAITGTLNIVAYGFWK